MDLANKSVLALITGASRGFGRSITEALLRTATVQGAHRLALVVHARSSSESTLMHIETDMMARYLTAQNGPISTALSITTLPLDLQRDDVAAKATRAIEASKRALGVPVDHAFLFNNAGVLRPGHICDTGFAAALAESLAVNVEAPAALSKAFLDAMPESASRHVVLTSSLAALQPFQSWSAYSASKAAANVLHACVAVERPDVRVLCYAPGPMGTDMTENVSTDEATHAELREAYAAMEHEGSFVDPDASAKKLIEVLLRDQFKSGEHLDFYDV